MRRLTLLLFWLIATTAIAQPELGRFSQADTRYGRVQVRALSQFEKSVFFNGQNVAQVTNRFIDILGAFRAQGAPYDWVILSTASGGNGCEAELVILGVSASGLTLTPPFGNCTDTITELRVFADGIEIDVPSNDLFNDTHRYRFDGQNFTVADLPRAAATGGAAEPASRWIGDHPAFLLRNPEEQARFLRIMTRSDFEEFYLRMTGPGAMIQDGDWVVGTACQRHQCNSDYAALAIRLSDGKRIAGYVSNTFAAHFFGGTYADMPPTAQQRLACVFAADPLSCN